MLSQQKVQRTWFGWRCLSCQQRWGCFQGSSCFCGPECSVNTLTLLDPCARDCSWSLDGCFFLITTERQYKSAPKSTALEDAAVCRACWRIRSHGYCRLVVSHFRSMKWVDQGSECTKNPLAMERISQKSYRKRLLGSTKAKSRCRLAACELHKSGRVKAGTYLLKLLCSRCGT